MLKILVSAYACEPNIGSESGIGWNFVQHLGQVHELWVITRSKNRGAIEAQTSKFPLPNVHWVYYDIPGGRYLRWKGTRFLYPYHYYVLWQIGAYFAARKLHKSIGFDLIHHVTFVNYWLPTLMPMFDAPFVWGPVGGGETAPECLESELTAFARYAENARRVAQNVSAYNPIVRYAAKRAAWAFATTQETANRLAALGCKPEVLPAVALSQTDIERLTKNRNNQLFTAGKHPDPKRQGLPFRVVSIGDLLPVKGVVTGMQAFAQFHRNCPKSEYWIIGEGRERTRLERTAHQLQLDEKVVFWGRMAREQVLEKLSECDVLLFPSLHDSGGWVSLEAMAAGLPVVCLDQGGPALQVTEATGFKITAITARQVIGDIANGLSVLYENPELRQELGAAGRERVKAEFTWERKAQQISAVYEKVLAERGSESVAIRASASVRTAKMEFGRTPYTPRCHTQKRQLKDLECD